jgi:hypothetical protein
MPRRRDQRALLVEVGILCVEPMIDASLPAAPPRKALPRSCALWQREHELHPIQRLRHCWRTNAVEPRARHR